ncbi:MAG TPA: patatin-like phospholipase family protein [Pseudonocardiaceae bacterium]|jgi:NTE family protein|nr:patatin-like phospholipase family protein [Pseudonocardiaceae bacterium]
MTISFVLAGGGALAATQVGMLRALLEAGVRPDLVVGTSAGAINGFCFAEHPNEDGVDRLTGLWGRMRRRDVFPVDPRFIAAGLVGLRDGLVSPVRLRAFLRRNVGAAGLRDTEVPMHIVVTDLASGRPAVLSDGPAVDALPATSALPGVFPPVLLNGRPLADGGITADTPVRQAEELGADVIYVLPAVGPGTPTEVPHGALPVLLHAVSHLFGRAAAADIEAVHGVVHVLPAPAHEGANPFDFRHTGELIDEGYTATKAALVALPRSRMVA